MDTTQDRQVGGTDTDAGRPPRRAYDGSRRRAAAEERRRRIVDVAFAMFAERGWTRTTIANVAAEAGVSVELVTTAFKTKAGLLMTTFERVTLGQEDLSPTAAVEALHLEDEPDPGRRLERLIDFWMAGVLRLAPLIATLESAAEGDDMASQAWRSAQEAHGVACDYFLGLFPEGTPAAGAAEELFLVTRAQTYLVLTRNRSWSDAQYRAWLDRSMRAALGLPPR